MITGLILAAQMAVTTKGYDAVRSGTNRAETILTPTKIRGGMTLQTTIPVIGDARGMEAWPLVMPKVPTRVLDPTRQYATNPPQPVYDIGFRDVMILPSMANIVRGVDPTTGAGIWQTPQICRPVDSDSTTDMWRINQHIGIQSTPVIDPATFKAYMVATCSVDGSPVRMRQHFVVLDVRTGAILSDSPIDASSNGQTYSSAPRKQRAALALWDHNGVRFVIVCSSSYSEVGDNSTGWVMMFDTFDNQMKAAISTHAGIWMSGGGPAVDSDGFIYLGAGNGPFNGTTTWGENVLKLQFIPPTVGLVSNAIRQSDGHVVQINPAFKQTIPATLTVVGNWALFSDASRTGANAQLTATPTPLTGKVAGVSAPSTVPGASMPMATKASPAWGDQDSNLTGMLVAKRNLYISAGKDGVGMVIDTHHFPRTQPADFANPKANCAKTLGVYEFGWYLGIDPCPMDLSQLNVFPGGKTRHIHSTPVEYDAPDGTIYLVFGAENSPVQVWKINSDNSMSYVARGREMASAKANGMQGGMPGSFCTAAAGVLWCSMPDGDANRSVTTGKLIAYDLTSLGKGDIIPTIWTSNTFVYNKFMSPMVYNGRVYLPNYDGGVMVYGGSQ